MWRGSSGVAPRWGAGEVEVDGAVLAVDGGEGGVDPSGAARERPGQAVASEEADVARLERVTLQLAADHAAVEHERVERHPGEAEAQAVEHRDQRHGLDLDA